MLCSQKVAYSKLTGNNCFPAISPRREFHESFTTPEGAIVKDVIFYVRASERAVDPAELWTGVPTDAQIERHDKAR